MFIIYSEMEQLESVPNQEMLSVKGFYEMLC